MKRFYTKDLVWYRNYQLGKKWEKLTIVKQVEPVAYLINNFRNIFQKHIDHLSAEYTSIEVDNESFSENYLAIDSNNQVLSRMRDSNRASSFESNTERVLPAKMRQLFHPLIQTLVQL